MHVQNTPVLLTKALEGHSLESMQNRLSTTFDTCLIGDVKLKLKVGDDKPVHHDNS
jgi:hypothetical protein